MRFFKAFVQLEFGKNELTLKTDNCTLKFSIYRIPKNTSRFLKPLYIVCHDDETNGEFQSDDTANNKLKNALNIIDLNIKLIQAFLSEIMYKKFQNRKTFALSTDLNPDKSDTPCEVFYSKLGIKNALKMTSREIFYFLAQEIKQEKDLFEANAKIVGVLSFTRYETRSNLCEQKDTFSRVRGFCAIGAEWLAIYGSPCLFTWSNKLENLEKSFTNNSLIDEEHFMNDSAFRNTYWACYSTTLGSLLHEISHILDLGHDLSGIMYRGFDDLDRFFNINFDECNCYSMHMKVRLKN